MDRDLNVFAGPALAESPLYLPHRFVWVAVIAQEESFSPTLPPPTVPDVRARPVVSPQHQNPNMGAIMQLSPAKLKALRGRSACSPSDAVREQ